jgi:hypothetical protein
MTAGPVRHHRRTLARMTRRQLLDVAWKLGAAAVVLPRASSTVLAQLPFSAYPFSLGYYARTFASSIASVCPVNRIAATACG